MATTRIWKIENRIDKVISYTINPEKTENQNYEKELYKSLHNTIEYAKADYKTEKQFYVTGINCIAETVLQDMIQTKKHFGKTKGILAFHGYQSFAKGEVTAKQAHEIGVKLAEEIWGDKYEVLVSTHLNTNCYHNHIVLNSVSFVDGKVYTNTVEHYALIRKTSDDLCREYGLSVIEEKPCGKLKIDYTKFYNSYIQKSDYYTDTKDDVDYAISQSYSYNNIKKLLEDMGYKVTIRANKISLCRPPYKRNIRIERSFGEEYSIINIEERILNAQIPKVFFPEIRTQNRRYYRRNKYNKKLNNSRGSLYKLYLYYCYLIKKFPDNRNKVKISTNMRKDIKKMEIISSEIKFLRSHHIETTKELFSFKEQTIDKLKKYLHERAKLRRKRTKITDVQERKELCDKILNLSDCIGKINKELGYCQDIENRMLTIKENINELEEKDKSKDDKQKGKEKIK